MWKTFLLAKNIRSIQSPDRMYWNWCVKSNVKCISNDYKPKIFI